MSQNLTPNPAQSLTIKEIFAPALGIPVERAAYRGDAPAYLLYSCLGQDGTIYADGKEAETGVMFALELYSRGNWLPILTLIRQTAEANDMIVVVEADTREADTGLYHLSMTLYRVGADYG